MLLSNRIISVFGRWDTVKKYKIMFFVMLIAVITSSGMPRNKADAMIGKAAPNFIIKDINGKTVELKKLFGKVIVLEITRLGRTKISEEERIRWRKFYNEHHIQGFEIMRVAYKSGFIPASKSFVENRARASLKKRQENWTVIIDWEGSIKKLYEMDSPNLILVIDRDGIIRHIRHKELIADEILISMVIELLKR